MGELSLHNLKKFECLVFVETGTGMGAGLRYAMTFEFKRFYSVEIIGDIYKKHVGKYHKGVHLINSDSVTGLKQVLPQILPTDSVLFWLDAHFPGADFGFGKYDDEIPLEKKYPLSEEIETILSFRPTSEDVFIIDDLQLYEPDREYELKASAQFLNKHRQFCNFEKYFNETHNMERDLRHQGFLIAVPKKRKNKMLLSILVPSTSRREEYFCPSLIGYLNRQIEVENAGKEVQLLWLGDNYMWTVGKKRNIMLSMAEGEYLTFIDDDDSVSEDFIKTILGVLKKEKPDVITFKCVTRVDGKDKTISMYSKDYTEYKTWHNEKGVMQWRGKVAHTMVWKSAIAKKHSFPEKNWREDIDWVQKANRDIKTEKFIDKEMYFYRMRHEVSETR